MKVSTGTFEEAVYGRQLYKQQQSRSAIEGAEEKRHFAGAPGLRTVRRARLGPPPGPVCVPASAQAACTSKGLQPREHWEAWVA